MVIDDNEWNRMEEVHGTRMVGRNYLGRHYQISSLPLFHFDARPFFRILCVGEQQTRIVETNFDTLGAIFFVRAFNFELKRFNDWLLNLLIPILVKSFSSTYSKSPAWRSLSTERSLSLYLKCLNVYPSLAVSDFYFLPPVPSNYFHYVKIFTVSRTFYASSL